MACAPATACVVERDLLPQIASPSASAPSYVVDNHAVCFAAETYARWRDGYDVVGSKFRATRSSCSSTASSTRCIVTRSTGRRERQALNPTSESKASCVICRFVSRDRSCRGREAGAELRGRDARTNGCGGLAIAISASRTKPTPSTLGSARFPPNEGIRSFHQCRFQGEAVWLKPMRVSAPRRTARAARATVLAKVRAAAGL